MRATIFNLEMLLMQCVCAFDWANLPASFFRHRCIIPHYSLTHSLAASLPFLPLFQPLSIPLSLPPSLSRWPLPARSPQGKLPQLRNAVLLHCNAPLCSALPPSLPPPIQHTHMDTHKHTHILWTLCTQKHPHIHTEITIVLPP